MITALNLQLRFENIMRTKDKVQGKKFQTSEMEEFLNQAQNVWLKETISEFDTNERYRRLLSPLTDSFEMGYISSPTVTDGLFWYLYGVPINTYSIVKESLIVGDKTVLVKPITYDEYLVNIQNKYRRPYDKLAWRLNNKNGHSIITTHNKFDKYKFDYIVKPTRIDIANVSEFDFEEEVMDEIVDAAVNLAINAMKIEEATTKEPLQQ